MLDCVQTEYEDAAGIITVLDGPSAVKIASPGIDGRFLPPVQLITDDFPDGDGAFALDLRYNARDLDVPIGQLGTTLSDGRDKQVALVKALQPKRGPGVLRLRMPDGSIRETRSTYLVDFKADDTGNSNALRQSVASFRALDPYWWDGVPGSQVVAPDPGSGYFFKAPFFPINILSSTAYGTITLANTGDAELFPVWIVTGPGNGLEIRDTTNGRSFSLDRDIVAGETVTVDTRPGSISVISDPGHINIFDQLGGDLWEVALDDTVEVRISLSNATAGSSVQAQYQRRFVAA